MKGRAIRSEGYPTLLVLLGFTVLLALVGWLAMPSRETEAFTTLWIRQFHTSDLDPARALAVHSSGVYLAGGTGVTLPGQRSAGGTDSDDAYLRKYDHEGNELWTRQFGSSASDGALALAVDASGVYVAGGTEGALPGQHSAGSIDAYLRKYDHESNELWTRQFGSSEWDEVYALAADASGVYVAGGTEGAFPGHRQAGNGDAYLRKYDREGNEIWTRQFGTSQWDHASALAVDVHGIYLSGYTYGALPGQRRAGGINGDASDAYVRKYNPEGNELWTRQFGSSASDVALALTVNASGVYVAGATEGALSGLGSTTGGDAYLRKYDHSGDELWTRQFGPSGLASFITAAFALAEDASGVYVAGRIEGTLPGQSSAGSTDAFVRKYSPKGKEIWTRQFGTSEWDEVYALAADANWVYVAGTTGGTLSGQSSTRGPDDFTHDAFVMKLAKEPLAFCRGQPATLAGTEGDDFLEGTPAQDVIMGLGGDDTIWGHNGDDIICGGPGEDHLYGNQGDDRLDGGPGKDYLNGGNGNDLLWGQEGQDRLVGAAGQDRLFGGFGYDFLWGGGGQDLLYGGDGGDSLYGDQRWDLLRGGSGNDLLFGGPGGDDLFGDTGRDFLYGAEGDDDLDGGANVDTCGQGPGSGTLVNCEE